MKCVGPPVASRFAAGGRPGRLPLMKQVQVALGIIFQDGKLLIARRKAGDALGGFWEFPGGKCEATESIQECVVRELKEELDVQVAVRAALSPVTHDYPTVRVTLHPFICDLIAGNARAVGSDVIKWIAPAELPDYQFPPANDSLLREIISTFDRQANGIQRADDDPTSAST
jgi:mutator protein MutT